MAQRVIICLLVWLATFAAALNSPVRVVVPDQYSVQFGATSAVINQGANLDLYLDLSNAGNELTVIPSGGSIKKVSQSSYNSICDVPVLFDEDDFTFATAEFGQKRAYIVRLPATTAVYITVWVSTEVDPQLPQPNVVLYYVYDVAPYDGMTIRYCVPSITAITPSSAESSPVNVTITGTYFGSDTSQISVLIGATYCQPVSWVDVGHSFTCSFSATGYGTERVDVTIRGVAATGTITFTFGNSAVVSLDTLFGSFVKEMNRGQLVADQHFLEDAGQYKDDSEHPELIGFTIPRYRVSLANYELKLALVAKEPTFKVAATVADLAAIDRSLHMSIGFMMESETFGWVKSQPDPDADPVYQLDRLV